MTDPETIACWQRIDERLTSSGRLSAEDIEALAPIGVAHVINLALADSPGILPDEEERIVSAGIAYTHIPVPFDAPGDAHYGAFCQAMAKARDETVHVHCVMNWRVSAFLYRWHCEVRGMDEYEARAIMERQWSPDTSDSKEAPAWRRFIRGE